MCFNNVVYFIAKNGDVFAEVYDKKALTKSVMITNSFYDGDDIISASYFYIKFITLFKYLTLYYVLYFEL